jgi:hypothetical protein
VRITHPAHPLRGQSLPVIRHHRKGDGTQLIEIQVDNGERRLVPRDWTDQCPSAAALPGTRFMLANLRCLRQHLDTLLRVLEESEILAPHTDTPIEGERDEHREPTQMVQTDGGPTCTGRGHAGANGLAPTGKVSGG